MRILMLQLFNVYDKTDKILMSTLYDLAERTLTVRRFNPRVKTKRPYILMYTL